MFKKKTAIPFGKLEYDNAVSFAHKALEEYKDKYDKIELLDYLMKTIRVDIQYDYLSKIIYQKKPNSLANIIPSYYINESNQKSYIYSGNLIDIKLNDKVVLTFPWEQSRIFRILPVVKKKGFKYMPLNHYSQYYTQLDICYVTNGNHSIMAGIHYSDGVIQSEIFDVALLYDHLNTDGVSWLSTHSNCILSAVKDFRIAILYEISRIKYNLLEQS